MAECLPQSAGGFCGELAEPDSDSGSSGFVGRFSPESTCSLPASLVPVSELPSGSLPSWVPLEDSKVCVQIVYSIPPESAKVPVPEVAPGTERWQADQTALLKKFLMIGLLGLLLLGALFMRTKARL